MTRSPCISVCEIAEASGLCRGCFRTIEEIRLWPRAGDEQRRLILERIAVRRREQPNP